MYRIITDKSEYLFDPQKSLLTDDAGNPVLEKLEKRASKKPEGLTMLKIQLGLKCNYACVYCKQADQNPGIEQPADLEKFVDTVKQAFPLIKNIYLAGGEPLLYRREMNFLIPRLRALYPEASMGMTSNGSLLTRADIDLFKQHGIYLVVSHDGPGQYLRSGDPLENPNVLSLIEEYERTEDPRLRFTMNGVLTPRNNRPTQIVGYIRKRTGANMRVSFEGVADLNTATSANDALLFDNTSGKVLADDILRGHIEGRLKGTVFDDKVSIFIDHIRNQTPSAKVTQKCGQLRDDVLAVDLHGRALVCHSAVSLENCLGTLGEPLLAKPDQYAWANRPTCSRCIVQQLCADGCLLNPYGSKEQEVTCKNDFYYHMGIFVAAFFEVTRDLILKIESI